MTFHGGTPAGWYDDGRGGRRWWDGQRWTEHLAPPPPRRSSRRWLIWLPVVALVVIGGGTVIGILTGGDTTSEWYQRGYAVGQDRGVSLARIGGSAESACNLALSGEIRFDDNARSTRVRDLRRGCVQGVNDALAK